MRADGRNWLGRLLGTAERPPPTRLTAQDAVALAATAPHVRQVGRPLEMATVRADGDRLVWRVRNAGIGAQTWVKVDDATGTIGDVHHVWGR
ncbi:hypothetical protein KZX46_02410 (plasmid) [Polymorphobacter sp. PAMC 29334]|uniref:hypothetical protein n=1 Tax=Polymorphobacter sp. PAMC 29334 TaxID=2862331 RepID=UPI001C793331|nr:hypothetical protein [Polymorphobacter sp. PAMC 29334]QYE33012.1 hypothetical protein KZX46_02410 [Polymorphobacter sp. PAMC 29334]